MQWTVLRAVNDGKSLFWAAHVMLKIYFYPVSSSIPVLLRKWTCNDAKVSAIHVKEQQTLWRDRKHMVSEFFFLLAWQWRVDAPFAVTVAFGFLFLCLEWNKKLNSVSSTPIRVSDTVELITSTFVNRLFMFYLTSVWCHVAPRCWSLQWGPFCLYSTIKIFV